MGWAADRLSRRWAIFGGVTIWSLAASGCGLAHHFWQLALGRFGLGAGEAALLPAGFSLIADRFPQRRLGLALSCFTSGAIIGGAGAILGGALLITSVPPSGVKLPLLGHLDAWQFVLFLCGLPCLFLSPLIFTVSDPSHKLRSTSATGASLNEVLTFMRSKSRFYFGHFIGFGLYSLCGAAVTSWLPAFRAHDSNLPLIVVM